MPLYDFCVVSDVEAVVRSQNPTKAYSVTTKPTLVEVQRFIKETTDHLMSVCDLAGYTTTAFHEASSTVALAITAAATTVTVANGTQFSAGDTGKVCGLASGIPTIEFIDIKSISGNILATSAFVNSYTALTVTIYVVNSALRILRDICAVGTAAKALQAGLMGVSPNKNEKIDELWIRYNGSEETAWGLWAIQNLASFLRGATIGSDAVTSATISSYNEQNEYDTSVDIGPTIERDMDF